MSEKKIGPREAQLRAMREERFAKKPTASELIASIRQVTRKHAKKRKGAKKGKGKR